MKINLKHFMLGIFCLCLFASCVKQEGDGGLASIRGKVFGYDTNSEGIVKDSAYLGDAKVYLSYGDHAWFDDQATTSSTGDYAFNELNIGNYTITVYSECAQCIFNQKAVVVKTSITESKEIKVLADIKVND